MKTISAELQTHLSGDVTTLAYCYKITFKDGEIMGFTSHDEDIAFEAVTYKSKSAFTPGKYDNDLIKSNESTEIYGVVDSLNLTDEDIKSGRIDDADIEFFMLNYASINDGRALIKKGRVAQISRAGNSYVFELTGLVENLNRNITEIYTPLCRTKFCDSKCSLDIESYSFTGSITAVVMKKLF